MSKVEPPTKVRERMKELVVLLEKWNQEYYVLDQPSVEDAVYDKHLKELKELETQYNFIFPNSPTQKAGYPGNNKFRPVSRKVPMLSLDSVDNPEDLFRFDERVKKILKTETEIEYTCEWKIDGLSVSLIYDNHRLTQISTRGNGIIGEDITFNKELIKNIPFFLPGIANCEVRGEVYMKKGEFWRLNEELKDNDNKLLANPRNAAAGSLRTLIPLQNRSLHFFAYQLFNQNIMNEIDYLFSVRFLPPPCKLENQLTCLQQLEKLGFAVSPDYQLFPSIQEAWKFIQKQEKSREELDFESDGIVVKVNNYEFYGKLGQTSRFPRWAMAYKFPAVVAISQVKGIYIEVSRSGRITYVAQIEPVILQGSRIGKVTLHNYEFIRNLKLNIGDKVIIKKAGDVIPQVNQVIKSSNSNSWSPPTNCPSCQEKLKWNSTNIYQVCDNDNCSQKNVNYLTHFASKTGVDIKGLSKKNIEKFYENGFLKKPTDFYYLAQKREELEKLPGFQKKSVDNILFSIENSKKKPLANLLTALGIPLLSSVKAKKIITFYPDFNSLFTAIENNEWEKIREILGEETQKEMKNYFTKPRNKELVKELNNIWKMD